MNSLFCRHVAALHGGPPQGGVTVEAMDRLLHPLEERLDVIFAAAHAANSSSLVAQPG